MQGDVQAKVIPVKICELNAADFEVELTMEGEIAIFRRNYRIKGKSQGLRGRALYDYVEKMTDIAVPQSVKAAAKSGIDKRKSGHIDPKKLQDSVDQTGACRNTGPAVKWCGPPEEAQAQRRRLRERGVEEGLEGRALLKYVDRNFAEFCEEKIAKSQMTLNKKKRKSLQKYNDTKDAVYSFRKALFKATVLEEEIQAINHARKKSKDLDAPHYLM